MFGFGQHLPSFIRPDVLTEAHYRYKPRIEWFYNGSGSPIVAQQAVDLDLTDATHGIGVSIETHAAADANRQRVIGIACRAIPDGQFGPVQVGGAFGDFRTTGTAASGVAVETGTVQWALLYGSGAAATAGHLQLVSTTYSVNHRPVAIALEAEASNFARCLLIPQLGLA